MSILDYFMLTDRKAVVTGGIRGIGKASAIALAEAGADVAILDILEDSETVKQIKELGREAFSIKVDLTKESEVNEAFAQIKNEFGRIDIVHNNAGIAYCVKCEDMTFEEWRKVIAIDLDAVFLVARAAGRCMIADGNGGSIINTGSMSGIIVNYPQEQVAYNAAKAGVIHLTKSLACEWAKHNIRVNCISPGYICTDMTPPTSNKAWMDTWFAMSPIKRLGTPNELAGAVLYLASSASSFTTGCNIVIDGGYCCY
ncbi:NAD(P)-dependent dehydrogenase (short-subunit alcohol dehydrogenase family) [Anaerobacterium chartisolvens]|uniref:NAD(P)-dependent dehydrogenase (Short-subunit alcohol dehydrogenase family) n=1 Tax=Anaerobacterium chartisolvens TaxID=1297424 RepID=A0A369B661_9FIRM|nr:SDR family oxidoreductase [Anaerobacterium chartisolvens]RCX16108.1 NAD(P)-dependent dehydrogenase (short-subunit alcohol dehydrogenase family) [Anaerobacterium chartisolvens]